MSGQNSTAERVTVFGADWCHFTVDTRRHLDRLGVPYTYVNVEQDPSASDWVKQQNGGMEVKPTLSIDEDVLSAPSAEALDAALRARGLLR